jgi:hypothetical protein
MDGVGIDTARDPERRATERRCRAGHSERIRCGYDRQSLSPFVSVDVY